MSNLGSDKSKLCDVAEACGGCPGILAPSYAELLRRKEALIRSACSDLFVGSEIQLFSAPNTTSYRRRIRLQVQNGRVRFFNADKSHSCTVLTEGLRLFINTLFEHSEREPTVFLGATHLDVRDRDLDGMFGMSVFGRLVEPNDLRARFPESYVGIGPDASASSQRFALVDHLSHYVPLTSFMQINAAVNRQIQHALLRYCQTEPPSSFWDVFSGVGNLSLPLAADGIVGGGEELNALSVQSANRTLREWGKAERYLVSDARQPNANRPRSVDLLLANPPRAGLRDGVVIVDELRPCRIFLMSCSLDAFVRDLKGIIERGYQIESIMGYDMFPYTEHVETVALLRRC